MRDFHTKIKADQNWLRIPFREIWNYRDLLWLIVKRDLTAVYKQTLLGPSWVIVPPLMQSVVFTVIFGFVANLSTDGTPKFIFYMCGTVFWFFFQGIMSHSGNSLVSNSSLYSKVYFPRMVIPLAGVCVNFFHFLLNFVIFVGFYAYFVLFVPCSLTVSSYVGLFLPLLVAQAGLLGLGVGLWVAALTTKYRDLRFALPLLTQLWMYGTPIAYPFSAIHRPVLKMLIMLNPMSFVVEAGRYLMSGSGGASLQMGVISGIGTIFVFITGLLLFNKVQRTFVDTI